MLQQRNGTKEPDTIATPLKLALEFFISLCMLAFEECPFALVRPLHLALTS
jgi:hypothetical protein